MDKNKRKGKEKLKSSSKRINRAICEREKAKGYAFGKDTPWQQQFEGQFPYQETDDQLRCIEEVKRIWKIKDLWTDFYVGM